MVKGSERLKYLCYRCYRCGRLLTKLEIIDKWHENEKDVSVVRSALCSCGSRHITPTNPKWWEELLLPRVWWLWALEVFMPWYTKRADKWYQRRHR